MRSFFAGIRDLPSSILNEFISNVVVVVIFALVAYLVEKVLIKAVPGLEGYKWIVYIILILSAGLMILKTYQRAQAAKIFSPDSDFRVIERYYYHCYKDMDNIVHQRRFKVRALRSKVSVFRNKFQWTGERYTLKCLNKNYRLIQGQPDGPMDTYEIDFGRPLKKGEEVEFTVEWQCENRERRAKHFFSCNITQPTDKVVLDLQINPPLQVNEIIKSISHIAGDQPSNTSRDGMTNGRYTWTIEEPLLMHRYKIDFGEII